MQLSDTPLSHNPNDRNQEPVIKIPRWVNGEILKKQNKTIATEQESVSKLKYLLLGKRTEKRYPSKTHPSRSPQNLLV